MKLNINKELARTILIGGIVLSTGTLFANKERQQIMPKKEIVQEETNEVLEGYTKKVIVNNNVRNLTGNKNQVIVEEVKKIADFVTLSNNEDGVAYAVKKYILSYPQKN